MWAVDFQFGATADGRRLKFLIMIDEHSRLGLAIRVGRRCQAKVVVAVREELTSLYLAPTYIRSDNRPEFIAQALLEWCEASATIQTTYIEPGSPWENGCAESFNGQFRVEVLNTELFTTAPATQLLAERWRWEYNCSGHIRPSRWLRPWKQLPVELQHDHNHPLLKAWTNNGGGTSIKPENIRRTTGASRTPHPLSDKQQTRTQRPYSNHNH